MLFEIVSIIALSIASIYDFKKDGTPNFVLIGFLGSGFTLQLLFNGITGLLSGLVIGLLVLFIGNFFILLRVWDFSDAIVLAGAVIFLPFRVFWILYYTAFFMLLAVLYMSYLSFKPSPNDNVYSEEIAIPIAPAILLGVIASIIFS